MPLLNYRRAYQNPTNAQLVHLRNHAAYLPRRANPRDGAIHGDLVGPIPVKLINGSNGYSRASWMLP
jgi:hypothetical protein